MLSLQELCDKLGEPFEGNASTLIKGVAEIGNASEGDLSFVANPKYVSKIPESRASVLIVPTDLETDFRPLIRSNNPYLTFTKAIQLFHEKPRPSSGGIHESCAVSPHATIGRDVTIMANVTVEDGAVIGERTLLYPGVFIGANARIGEDCTLYPHVSVYDGCTLGDNTIIHSGSRIGTPISGTYTKPCVPVELGKNVEIGANVVIAGDELTTTTIGEGTKIDNLVQIGGGTCIGNHCIIVAQVTIGDHVTMDERVTIAGQVVLSPGVSLGARARIGAQSVVMTDVPPDSDFWGSPAQPHRDEKRMKANVARLPRIIDRVHRLEDHVSGKS